MYNLRLCPRTAESESALNQLLGECLGLLRLRSPDASNSGKGKGLFLTSGSSHSGWEDMTHRYETKEQVKSSSTFQKET